MQFEILGFGVSLHSMAGEKLVLFDGVCALCDRTMRFLDAQDRRRLLMFAPLQGVTATEVFARHPGIDKELRTILFVDGYGASQERVYERSEAILQILRCIGGCWSVISWLRIIPRGLRDPIYSWIGRNRYRWFGKREECRVPTEEERGRFLR